VMDRLVLSDAAWERMAPLIIGRPDQKGSTGRDNRMFVEGVLWIVRTGSPWPDLPEVFGVGTASSGASVDGASRESGGGSLRRCPMIQTSNI
jgi:transposase